MQYEEFIKANMEELQAEVPNGVDHHCFACSPQNSAGLHLHFFSPISSNNGTTVVFSKFRVGYDYCGFPRYAHGGILATLLDELMAHAAYRRFRRYGITKELTVKYLKPVIIDQIIYIKAEIDSAKITSQSKEKFEVELNAMIYSTDNGFLDPKPKIHALGKATMVILPQERYRLNYQE